MGSLKMKQNYLRLFKKTVLLQKAFFKDDSTLQMFLGYKVETLKCSVPVLSPVLYFAHSPIAPILSVLSRSLFLSPSLPLHLSLSLTFLSLSSSLSSAVAIGDVKILTELEGSTGNAKYITSQRNIENRNTYTEGFKAFTALTHNCAQGLFYNLTSCQSS